MQEPLKVKRGHQVTLEEMKEFGNNLKIIDDLLNRSYVFSYNKFGATREVTKELYKQKSKISELRSHLDNEVFHLKIEDMEEDFDLMDIFYGERDYERIKRPK